MKRCDTCKWADDSGQPEGNAVCRKLPPVAALIQGPNGQAGTIGMFPPVRMMLDGCAEHEEGRDKLRIVYHACT